MISSFFGGVNAPRRPYLKAAYFQETAILVYF